MMKYTIPILLFLCCTPMPMKYQIMDAYSKSGIKHTWDVYQIDPADTTEVDTLTLEDPQ